jgi:two-component system phosphate regulon sensor histidine kinase PhoR
MTHNHPQLPTEPRQAQRSVGETTSDNLEELAALIIRERDTLLARWRQQVRQFPAASELDIPTLNDHIPSLLDELIAALQEKSEQTIPEALCESSPVAHGLQRVQDAYDIEEVVAEYNILRGCIHDLADDDGLNLQGRPFHILNRIFDHAIGLALKTYSTQRALEVQRRREEYLSFVAHDLRTPLSAISLAERVLEHTLPEQVDAPETARMLKSLRRNVQHLERLTAQVLKENENLQTETGIKLECREFDLWPLVESLIHDLNPVGGTASTKLINKVPDDLVVYADAGLLRRVFQNLIANAIKYTPRGEVVISAQKIGARNAVECVVKDNGAGIPAELIEKIFDKGETDQENEHGTGLGLAIVKTFVEAHGGKVTVESKKDRGSTFRFTLPTNVKGSSLKKH